MKRFALVAAIAAVAVQPVASLPLPGKSGGSNRSSGVDRQGVLAWPTIFRTSTEELASPPVSPPGGSIGAEGVRQRMERLGDRCLPKRESFPNRRMNPARRLPDNPFRTPTFRAK